ncbi:farnesyltransferase beta subunit, putative [Plasmodium relictum]|uniref:Protein farnesyltransferase subunit beta n=1 Tax=Plasmodium relictum TaxID=85471 RepID=A0A1J1H620_PLARL|nr:farnesyltransferase beta subunit, putative [Plasmodium relictum]CRH00345.1 farnesyltransferase beta subunit, putative [Plasmodium relictum]
MDKNETYILRYNKKKILIELLFELIKYEKKKDGYKIDFENDKCYKYIENIVKLLFNYIFNLNKETSYYTTDYNFDKNSYLSSSDNLSEDSINSSDDELFELFNFNKNDVKEENEYFNNTDKDIHKLDCIDKNKDKISNNKKNESMNINNLNYNNMNNVKTNSINNELFENIKHKQNKNEEKNLYGKSNISDFFFNFHLNCSRNTQTIREKKKIEKQILSIYYTSFSSSIIDILLNNSEVEISDLILFFIFENVGNIHDISSFFSKGFYTFNSIYSYIEEYKSDKSINESEKKYNSINNFLYHEKYDGTNENLNKNDYANNSHLIKVEKKKEIKKEEIHSNNKEFTNKDLYSSNKKVKNEEISLNTHNENIYGELYINDIYEENNEIIYINEILKQKSVNEDNTNCNEKAFASQFENIMIKDNMLFVQNFKFKLNKSSVLLNKFISILNLQLEKQKHFKFCLDIFFFKNLKLNFLEASKPWIFYWCIHTIYILYNDFEIEQKLSKGTFSYIKKCVFLYLNKIKNDKDCFGGGLNQYTHIATTYAAVCVFIYLHDDENNFLSFLDKKKIHSYILKLKCADGSFRLHKNGEIDMRGTYCAISICSMCHILTKKVKKNVEKYILSCQNYEGGFTSEKFQECHGGYTYCALATLCILGKIEKINLNNLMCWLINKQSNLEGSFMGRTNKLVDSCYSFWIGSIFFLINEIYILKQIFQQNELKKKSENKKYKMLDYINFDELNNLENNDLKKKNTNFVKHENSITNLTSTYDLNDNYNNLNNEYYSCDKNEKKISLNKQNKSNESIANEFNYNVLICNKNNLSNDQNHKDEFFFTEDFKNKNKVTEEKILFNMNHAKLYLLLCSQSNKGGMKDKPKEKVDYYHTCYALSGLSLIENYISSHMHKMQNTYDKDNINKLNKIHILYNITVQKVYKSYNYFSPNIPLNEDKINHKIGKGAYLYLKRLVQ